MIFLIKESEHYTGNIGELVAMLNYSRDVLLKEISSLTMEELDFIAYKGANSIGALILHIASIEYVHQIITFEERDLVSDELRQWESALFLGEKARKQFHSQPLEYYTDLLHSIREKSIIELRKKNEDWLYEENAWDNGVTHNNYWLWYHVMEDEINHRGQIRMLKKIFSLQHQSLKS